MNDEWTDDKDVATSATGVPTDDAEDTDEDDDSEDESDEEDDE